MTCRKHSRRAFLRVMGGALGGAWLTLDLAKVAHAAQEARRAQDIPENYYGNPEYRQERRDRADDTKRSQRI